MEHIGRSFHPEYIKTEMVRKTCQQKEQKYVLFFSLYGRKGISKYYSDVHQTSKC
jgi:hypothetical protein